MAAPAKVDLTEKVQLQLGTQLAADCFKAALGFAIDKMLNECWSRLLKSFAAAAFNRSNSSVSKKGVFI